MYKIRLLTNGLYFPKMNQLLHFQGAGLIVIHLKHHCKMLRVTLIRHHPSLLFYRMDVVFY
ncbi:MAG: hypothetical protein H6622_07750 [Halobacteriovoraceae bacterium]|nr:hypothetical protein [Halobacteriovoraceae bacterium]